MRKNLLCISIIVSALLFFILTSTLIVTSMKNIHSYSIEPLNIQTMSELEVDDINLNYSYIIDYILGKTESEKFQLPTLKFSNDGAIHFYEVKKLFDLAKVFSIATFIFLIILVGIYKYTFKSFYILKGIGITTIIIPLITSLVISLNFKFFFYIFHKIFFNNDKWLFDPITDPIINILPQQFFALCGVLIILLTMLMGGLTLLIHKVTCFEKTTKKYIDITTSL